MLNICHIHSPTPKKPSLLLVIVSITKGCILACSVMVSALGSTGTSSSSSGGGVIPAIKKNRYNSLYSCGLQKNVRFLSLLKGTDQLPVSFSAMGLNSSGLRYKSWSVSSELKIKRPSAPSTLNPSS